MNSYPSWIQRIPEMIETLALLDREWIDRQLVERVFDLRKTAAFHLLRRMGAQRCGNSLGISRDQLMARLREAHETEIGAGNRNAARRFVIGLTVSKAPRAENRSCQSMPLSKTSWKNCERLDCRAPSSSRRDCSPSAATIWKISCASSFSSPKWRIAIMNIFVR